MLRLVSLVYLFKKHISKTVMNMVPSEITSTKHANYACFA